MSILKKVIQTASIGYGTAGLTDRIDGEEIYWLRVLNFKSGASLQFDGGIVWPVFGFTGYVSRALLDLQTLQTSAQVPVMGEKVKAWRRIDIQGPIIVEYSSNPREKYPGPTAPKLWHPGQAAIEGDMFSAGITPGAIAAQSSGFQLTGSSSVSARLRRILLMNSVATVWLAFFEAPNRFPTPVNGINVKDGATNPINPSSICTLRFGSDAAGFPGTPSARFFVPANTPVDLVQTGDIFAVLNNTKFTVVQVNQNQNAEAMTIAWEERATTSQGAFDL